LSDSAVVVDNVSKRFRLFHERNNSLKSTLMRRRHSISDEFWALQAVSFEVPQGTTFGLIGENGSGKSTMLKCIANILRPDTGSLAVTGKISALLELGAGFHPELSGRENVFLNGAILGLRQKELRRRFDEIVDFAGIGNFIDEPVKNYSSGMYVRLGFSVAINVDPDVLLIDEVLAVGDEAFQRKCNEKFAELKAAGKTIILVSHGMSAVEHLCDRVAWFDHGHIKMIDAPGVVIDEYTGNVQMDRHPDSEGKPRWGSGEGTIDRLEIINAFGQSMTRVRSGDSMTIRFHYSVREPLERPVFELGIHTIDGTYVTGPNTREAGCVPARLVGSGYVDLVFDRLLLLPGTYNLSCSLLDSNCLHPYDVRQKLMLLDVERGPLHEEHGLVSLAGVWRAGPADSAFG
jgi:ABC-type polysaccharide/polyol phosphate transport system ATPase subunit